MNKSEENRGAGLASGNATTSSEIPQSKTKQKNVVRRRRRRCSSSDSELILPDNTLETDRNVYASALKNNLDDTSVRKILKKVVTNDHVLALVQLQEEAERDSVSEDKNMQPKLTRAKVKELKKVSPRSKAWNLADLELIPIEHIPVKTRPEVKALIAQELPEDEDDEEYEPTHDDVLSEDEHEQSCSDLDSQPRTPATPASRATPSPRVRDGPFKVPQEVSSARRKLVIEDDEEATIALRTRSKLSLSTTTIEHLESSFVPPDEVPPPEDNVWNQFLSDCLHPAPAHDDDEDDPEYNAAADADALCEEDEDLASSLIKISKKELSDLVTELFNVMPATVTDADDDISLENLANSVLTDTSRTEVPRFEGKTEPVSDEENAVPPSKRLKFEKGNTVTYSVGKTERDDTCATPTNHVPCKVIEQPRANTLRTPRKEIPVEEPKPAPRRPSKSPEALQICIEEADPSIPDLPPVLQSTVVPQNSAFRIEVDFPKEEVITKEQVMILQQQLRMHIQIATSNFLQLHVHPTHWQKGPTYKGYLETLGQVSEANAHSVVNVCNLKPALELIKKWEEEVSQDIPENKEMVNFIKDQMERNRRRFAQHSVHVGAFHPRFLKTVAESNVFLYPYLLPHIPFKADHVKRSIYLRSEDSLIVLGIDQFWRYIEENDNIFKCISKKSKSNQRRGLNTALQLVSKHMLPNITPKQLLGHVHNMRGARSYTDKNNPIYNYFNKNEIKPVEHCILPFSPEMTLYDHPEHEMPRAWARYLAKSSKRFKDFVFSRGRLNLTIPSGVPVASVTPEATVKRPLPHDFIKPIKCNRNPQDPMTKDNTEQTTDKPQTKKIEELPLNMYQLVTTTTGSYLVPLEVVTAADTNTTNIVTTSKSVTETKLDLPKLAIRDSSMDHCPCCNLLRKTAKRQTLITDFFTKIYKSKNQCYCGKVRYPNVTKKMRLLANNFKNHSGLVYNELERRLEDIKNGKVRNDGPMGGYTLEELVSVTTFQLKVVSRSLMSKFSYIKVRCKNLLTRFNPDTGDPVILADALFKTCGKEMLDLYYDFLEFLTPEQADKIGDFTVYFVRNCAKKLMDKVEEQVKDTERRARILQQLKRVFSDHKSTSCQICSLLLDTMAGYDALALYTFSLFPHRKEDRIPPPPPGSRGAETAPVAHIRISGEHMCQGLNADCEEAQVQSEEPAETDTGEETDSSNDGESTNINVTANTTTPEDNTERHVDPHEKEDYEKLQEPHEEDNPQGNNRMTTEIKVEHDSTMDIDIEDSDIEKGTFIVTLEEIKEEEESDVWTRADDKLILEVLKQITPEERKDKSIAEILEEKNVLGIISEKIRNKTEDDVRERMMYILSVLVVSES